MAFTFPLHNFGGTGAIIHLAVANGFPPQVYEPILRPLIASHRVICLPPRALWPGEQPPAELRQWDMMAEDMLAGMREHHLANVIAVGHSMGGVVSLIAAVQEPERFKALVLLDPSVFLPEWLKTLAQMQRDGSIREIPMATGALRRRRSFESVESAFMNWRDKPLFQNWPDETLRRYAQYGTRPLADQPGCELVWSPEWEAFYFCTVYTRTWEIAPQFSQNIPLLVIRGSNSDTFLPQAAERLRETLPWMTYAEAPGHGHLFPLSAPELAGQIIAKWVTHLTHSSAL
jgi:pimeloyl-ACP methyl ester carboxylesterase